MTCELLSGDSWTSLPSPLPLYAGQQSSLRLTVVNTGAEAVHELEVECLPSEGGGGAPPPLVTLELGALEAALPLNPGQVVVVVARVTGVADTSGCGTILRPEDSVSVASETR